MYDTKTFWGLNPLPPRVLTDEQISTPLHKTTDPHIWAAQFEQQWNNGLAEKLAAAPASEILLWFAHYAVTVRNN